MSVASTILIADDDPWSRDMLSRNLESDQYCLLFAEDGFQALELAHAHVPDLILLDVMMPGMDGYGVCQALRTDPDLADVPILMITALDDRSARLKGIEAGADDFIVKPFDRVELRARVQTVTRLNRYRRIQTERAKFQWVVDRANEGYLILDGNGCIQYMNAQARLFLHSGDDQEMQSAPEFLALARKRYNFEPAAPWITWPDPTTQDAPRFLVRPETTVSGAFWLAVESFELPPGSEAGVLIRLQDISEQITIARQQRTFHALINHRLRTPMTVMGLGLQVLSMDAEQYEELSSTLTIVKRGADRLQSDIEDVLAYLNAPGPSGEEPGLVLSDLPALLNYVAANVGVERLSWEIAPDVGDVQIGLGSSFVEILLLELLENSLKFHPDQDPSVHVTVRMPSSDVVQLSVQDDGVHLSPDQLGKVWNPYYQAETSFSGQGDGLGLGLSTVASIVWAVGGRCNMNNRTDRLGVEVGLYLPRFQLDEEALDSDAGKDLTK